MLDRDQGQDSGPRNSPARSLSYQEHEKTISLPVGSLSRGADLFVDRRFSGHLVLQTVVRL